LCVSGPEAPRTSTVNSHLVKLSTFQSKAKLDCLPLLCLSVCESSGSGETKIDVNNKKVDRQSTDEQWRTKTHGVCCRKPVVVFFYMREREREREDRKTLVPLVRDPFSLVLIAKQCFNRSIDDESRLSLSSAVSVWHFRFRTVRTLPVESFECSCLDSTSPLKSSDSTRR
jgi:hypothetical protein